MAPHGGGDDASSVKSGGGGSSSSAAGGGGVSHLELTDLGGNGGTQPAADDRPTGKKGKEKEKQLPDAEYIDTDKYVVKVQPQERAAYWAFLVTTKRPVKIPEGQETDEEVVERTFPWHQGLLFTIVTSQFWDYVYVVFLMAFLTLIGLKRDGFLPSDFAEYVWSVCTAMRVLMFFSQVVPIVGMVYFVNYANLRTHYRASQNFPSWCVNTALLPFCLPAFLPATHSPPQSLASSVLGRNWMSVMVAQFIEEHFYGGVGNYVKRKERVYVDPVIDPENDDESSEGVSIASSIKEEMKKRGVWKERKRIKVRVCVWVCFYVCTDASPLSPHVRLCLLWS